ncbi:MAG: peroxiredoxin [Bacteroidales bacterium]|nr:peroxiredoxin [Bacteroidales bacterium]
MEIGDKAYEFCLPNELNENICLKDQKGKWVILYFYPKDNTSGCTKEAIDFTEKRTEFTNKNAVIYGVSPDSIVSHVKFISKHTLSIPLLSDEEKTVMKAYGAWGLKKNYGKEYEGVIRSTFIINPDGIIAHKWHNVSVQQKRKDGIVKHAEIVLKKLTELQQD